MLRIENPEDIGAGRIVFELQKGRNVLTIAPWTDDDGEEIEIVLNPGDHLCQTCDTPIESFRHAPYANALVRQLNRYGATYCQDHLDEVRLAADADDSDTDSETEVVA